MAAKTTWVTGESVTPAALNALGTEINGKADIGSGGGGTGGLDAETVRDTVAAMLVAGTNVTLTYNDTANTLTVAAAGGGGGLDVEAVRDAIGTALIGAGVVSVTVNDAADTITVASTATVNSPDATLLARANHTGTQTVSTISDAVRTVAVSTGSETRSATTGVVLWIGGGTQPTNMAAGDLWFQGATIVVPTITTTTLPTMTVSSAFSQTLAATGSTPITWSVPAGTLPAGLSLNTSTGALTGTPTTAGAYSFTVTATNSGGSDTQAYSGTVGAASSGTWLQRTLVQSARNASTTHTVNFTSATAGNKLVMVASAAATITTPSGWTRQATIVGNTELSVYTKTASAGESSVSMVLSASNYLLVATVYEFASTAAYVNGVSSTVPDGSSPLTAANPNLTGLTGTNLVFGAVMVSVDGGRTASSVAWTGPVTVTEDSDLFVAATTNDGYAHSVGVVQGYTGSSFQPTGTVTLTGTGAPVAKECVTFAVNVP